MENRSSIFKQNTEIEDIQHKNRLGCRQSWFPHFLYLHRTKGPAVTPAAEETAGVHQSESPLPGWGEDHTTDSQQNKKHC